MPLDSIQRRQADRWATVPDVGIHATGWPRQESKRDVKLAEKRDKDRGKLRTVIEWVLAGEPLPRELGDHPLKGEWKPSRDLHSEADWVLIYRVDGDAVRFERAGTHADLFGK